MKRWRPRGGIAATNEELAVTNEELRNRNDELNHANRELKSSGDHSQAIIETMREGLLVFDSDFRVMQANHSFYECFNTRPQDTIDRTLFELGDGQWSIPMLHEPLEKVLPEKRSLRDYEITHTFPAIGERVMLLNARHLTEEHAGKEMIYWRSKTSPNDWMRSRRLTCGKAISSRCWRTNCAIR
jgi:two-component system, chemotaxis family, CheB/CheR fusion protein